MRFLPSLVLLTGILLAPSAGTRASESAYTLLARDLQTAVYAMPKEVRVYNYFSIRHYTNDLATPETRDAYLKRYLAAALGRFWDFDVKKTNFMTAGPGLYAAIDPYESRIYGNAVVEILLPKGALLLRVKGPTTINADTVNALLEEGVVQPNALLGILKEAGKNYLLTADTLQNMIGPEYVGFRKLMHQFFLDKGISLIEYNWSAGLVGFCNKFEASAFVIVGAQRTAADGSSYIEENFAKTLVSGMELPELSPVEAETIPRVRYFRMVLEEVARVIGVKQRQELVARYYPDRAVKNEIMSKTYTCEN